MMFRFYILKIRPKAHPIVCRCQYCPTEILKNGTMVFLTKPIKITKFYTDFRGMEFYINELSLHGQYSNAHDAVAAAIIGSKGSFIARQNLQH